MLRLLKRAIPMSVVSAVLYALILLWTSLAWAQTATETPTRTLTPTITPTLAAPDVRRANLNWALVRDPGGLSNTQPVSQAAGQGILIFSALQLRNLQVVCPAVATGSVVVKKNDFLTNLQCSYTGHTGCNDLYSTGGHFVNVSVGDIIRLDGGSTNCNVTISVVNQDGSPADALVPFGTENFDPGDFELCIPTSDYGPPSCAGAGPDDSFIVPRASTLVGYSRNGEACGIFCPSGSTFTVANQTTSSDIFTLTLAPPAASGSVACTSGCAVAAKDRLHVRYHNFGASGLGLRSLDHLIEFSGTGQIITMRGAQWAGIEDRYINEHTTFDILGENSLYCMDDAGVAQHLCAQVNGTQPNNVDVVFCSGPSPASLDCVASGQRPRLTIPAMSTSSTVICDDAHALVVPQGYVYTFRVGSPGQNTGTLGISMEFGPPATPVTEVSGCGFMTPSVAPTPTGTHTPGNSPTPTESRTITPTVTVTPTETRGCKTFTPTVTPTPAESPGVAHQMPWFFE